MPCYSVGPLVPVVHPSAFVHPLASVMGDVIIGPECYIGPGASLRGDVGRITVAARCSIQDSVTIHVSSQGDTSIEAGAVIAHGAVVHGCVIGADVLVGINAVVLDGAMIGHGSCIAALALVKSDYVVPPRSLVLGNPARIVRTLAEDEIAWRDGGLGIYPRLAQEAQACFTEVAPLRCAQPLRPRFEGDASPVRFDKSATNSSKADEL